MKKGFVYKITWAVLVILGLFAASCNKDLKVDVKDVKIINEHVDSTTNSVKITGEYVFPSVLKAIDVYLSNNENLDNAEAYSAVIDEHQFSVDINELVGRTKYYYCYEFNNGLDKARSEVKSFRTAEYADAEIITEVKESSIKATTAVLGGVITSTNGYDVVGYGWCWTKNSNLDPDINAMPHWDTTLLDNHISVGRLNDKRITGLLPNTPYYVWAYFISSKDYKPVYGQRKEFTTMEGRIILAFNVHQNELGTAYCNYYIDETFNGSPISEHGICWSTNPNPTPDNPECHTSLGEANGQSGFSAEMAELTAGEKYYVCAYATNEIKTWTSEVKDFMAFTGKPVFSNFKVTKIKNTSAYLSACVDNGGDNSVDIRARGFLWSMTNDDPRIGSCDKSIECTPNQYGGINLDYKEFEPEQVYHVRPYARYNGETYDYGTVRHFKTTKLGGLPGYFIINDNGGKVCFSQSNLQYRKQEQHWYFVDDQFAMVEANGSVGEDYASQDVVSLFGWGTSGHNHNNNGCYQPWSTSPNNTKYWAYGNSDYSLFNNDGTADWGHNRIHVSNSWTVTQETDGWRTLTSEEWKGLIDKCKEALHFSAGTIEAKDGNRYYGLILLPDGWENPGVTFNPKNTDWEWSTNVYNSDEWDVMEASGAVFLPAAGFRYKGSGTAATEVGHRNHTGYYWSSTNLEQGTSWRIRFSEQSGFKREQSERHLGQAVRLVHDL